MAAFSRRDFARLLALSGSAALVPSTLLARGGDAREAFDITGAPLPQTPANPDEAFWRQVRARFLVPRDLTFLNAANLCPASLPAIEALERKPAPLRGRPVARNANRADEEDARNRGGFWPRRCASLPKRSSSRATRAKATTSSRADWISRPATRSSSGPTTIRAISTRGGLKAQRFGFTVVTVPVVTRIQARRATSIFSQGVDSAHEARRDHARQQQLRRPAAGRGDLRGGAPARRPSHASTARRRSACSIWISAPSNPTSTRARCTSGRAVRRKGDALRQRRRAGSHPSVGHRRVCRRSRDLAHARGHRPARRRVDCGRDGCTEVPGHRLAARRSRNASRELAQALMDGLPPAARRHALDRSDSRAHRRPS